MMNPDYRSILDMGSERVVADLAVKVLEENPGTFMDLLDMCFLEKNEPDLLNELAVTINIMMEESEISLKTCGRKMLRRIEDRRQETGDRRQKTND